MKCVFWNLWEAIFIVVQHGSPWFTSTLALDLWSNEEHVSFSYAKPSFLVFPWLQWSRSLTEHFQLFWASLNFQLSPTYLWLHGSILGREVKDVLMECQVYQNWEGPVCKENVKSFVQKSENNKSIKIWSISFSSTFFLNLSCCIFKVVFNVILNKEKNNI